MAHPDRNPSELTHRQAIVARTYIQGLERDREHLHDLQRQMNETIWEAMNAGAINRALLRALVSILARYDAGNMSVEFLDSVEGLIAEATKTINRIWICACGHSTFDHDEFGCQYLGCVAICGKS